MISISDHSSLAQLPLTERLELVQALIDTIRADIAEPPLPPELCAEIDRRIADFESGRVASIPWTEAQKRLQRRD